MRQSSSLGDECGASEKKGKINSLYNYKYPQRNLIVPNFDAGGRIDLDI
jgi:hypothetical protein